MSFFKSAFKPASIQTLERMGNYGAYCTEYGCSARRSGADGNDWLGGCGGAAGHSKCTTGAQQPVGEAAKKGRVTLLQRLVIGAGVDKIAIDTPQAVTVVDQEQMDQDQPTTIGDTLRDVPGVTAIGSDRIFGEAFNIRGIGGAAAADESKIIINVDGTPKFYEQYRMGSFFSDPELYKQVEVLRGPASSTLYGSGALGGVINLTTKDAADFLVNGQNNSVRVKSAYDSNGTGILGSTIYATRLNENFEFLGMAIIARATITRTAMATRSRVRISNPGLVWRKAPIVSAMVTNRPSAFPISAGRAAATTRPILRPTILILEQSIAR